MQGDEVLITGANGEVGHGLIVYLCTQTDAKIVAVDIQPLDESLKPHCSEILQGDILDPTLLDELSTSYSFSTIYHLASILSTSAERNPERAHNVNVNGTLNLLHLAMEQAGVQGRDIKFLYPSSIAAFGLPDLETKTAAGKVREDQFCAPTTMYGCNKLYCEWLGQYFHAYYRQLEVKSQPYTVDFRCLRYPGLISAITVPTGGTSDYGPEMLHHAAQGKPYKCFVRPDAALPFMAMPDAVKALVGLAEAPAEKLSRRVYNVNSFSLTAAEFLEHVNGAFPGADVAFEPDVPRQGIVDTWPADIDDDAARRDWGWEPDYDIDRAFVEYLIPTISKRYA
jgi:threonine 3-dehydrogenase